MTVGSKERTGSRKPAEYECFLAVVKDVSYRGPVCFSIEDRNGAEIFVEIVGGKISINGEHMSDAAALVFISRKQEQFEQLFMAAAKQYMSPRRLMGELYLAKIADAADRSGRKAKLYIRQGKKRHLLTISKRNGRAAVDVDGAELGEEEGRRFIRGCYIGFLEGYREAMKELEEGPVVRNEKSTEKDSISACMGKDGRVRFDLGSFLDARKKIPRTDRLDTSRAKQILKKRRGHVE